MTDTITAIDTDLEKTETPVEAEAATDAPAIEAEAPRNDRGPRAGGDRGAGRPPMRRPGRGRERTPRERSEFDQATLDVRRVARVMAGGRRFSFSVTVVIGDKKGRVGVGLGKGADTALAIDKAVRSAKKAIVTIPLTKGRSIAHDIHAKYSSSTVEIIPSPGRGLVAGSAMRVVLEYAGVTDVVAKIQTRTKNKLTIARATVAALKTLKSS